MSGFLTSDYCSGVEVMRALLRLTEIWSCDTRPEGRQTPA